MSKIEDILSAEQQLELVSHARLASRNAYCPYSGFAVGAAILSITRRVHLGCNVENAAYSPSLCAERNAVGAMVASGEQAALAVAIYTPTGLPTAPCGVCRQVLHEFSPDIWIISGCDSGQVLVTSLSALFPQAFGPHDLQPQKNS
jgi:cytidine deaminase